MMFKQLLVGCGLIAIATIGQHFAGPKDSLVAVASTDPAVHAASEQARAKLPEFLGRLSHPAANESEFTVKYDLNYHHPERGPAEIIWAGDLKIQGKQLIGKLADDPATAGFKEGQPVVIEQAAIRDWAVKMGDRYAGHYTTRVLLSHLPQKEAQAIRARLTPD